MQVIPQQSNSIYISLFRLISKPLSSYGKKDSIHRSDYTRSRRTIERLLGGTAKGVKATDIKLGGIQAQCFTPTHTVDNKIILYTHGGGFCVGSIKSHSGICSTIAQVTHHPVYSHEYRLAPEHPYPSQLEDTFAVYQALLDQGYTSQQIILAGESAGGALSLALAQQIRDKGLSAPAGIIAITPWCDFENQTATLHKNKDPILQKEDLFAFSRDTFKPGEAAKYNLINSSFKNLPPIYLLVGGRDIIEEENINLGKILEQYNKGCRLEYWQGMPHAFPSVYQHLKEARQSIVAMGGFIAQLP